MLEASRNKIGCGTQLPAIPDKRYFSISEVSKLCEVKPHVLRYWEQEFSQLAPIKRRGNRRYYQHDDVMLVREIRELLYLEGYTIGGACQKLTIKTTPKITTETGNIAQASEACELFSSSDRRVITKLINELEELQALLN